MQAKGTSCLDFIRRKNIFNNFIFDLYFTVILLLYAIATMVTSRRLKNDPCNGLPDETFILNPKGCKYFFSCKDGLSVGAYCPHGLLFNPIDRICDLPNNVDCHFDDPVPTTTTTTVTSTQTLWTPSSSSIETTTSFPSSTTTMTTLIPTIDDDQDDVVCPMHDAYSIQFVASKINCRHYYICYHGRAVLQKCAKRLYWNAKENKCDRPADAGCNVSLLVGRQLPRINFFLLFFPDVFTCVVLQIIPKPPMRFPKCPDNGNRFYPHPTECDYYIYCRSGFYSIQQCPFYHHWDVTTESCRWRRFTHCTTTKRHRISLRENNSRKYF